MSSNTVSVFAVRVAKYELGSERGTGSESEARIREYVAAGFLVDSGERLIPTSKGMLFADMMARGIRVRLRLTLTKRINDISRFSHLYLKGGSKKASNFRKY